MEIQNDDTNNNNRLDTESYDDNEINFAEVKKNFLKAFDENMNQNKEKIKQITPIFQKMDEIFKKAKLINGDIKKLEQATQVILEKQREDYLKTFVTFMDSIRKELTQKLEEMEIKAEENRKANDIRIIKTERDFFRLEAIRLNGICKSFKEKIDELTFNNKSLTDELNSLKIKWKESENINKQLLFELESNIQYQKEQKNLMNQGLLNSQKFNPNAGPYDPNNPNYESMNEEDMKKMQDINILEEQLRRTKIELRREKEKSNKILSNLNKYYLERNKYETIFQNCVEETRKIIFNRRLKENKGFKIKNRTGIGKYDCKVNLSAKLEEFLPSDKYNTLENFIFNEEVFNLVKEAIFSKPKRYKKGENAKDLMNSFKFYDPDWKMKEIVENANENGQIFMPIMPLIHNARSSSVGEKPKNSNMGGGGQFYRTGRINLNCKNSKLGLVPNKQLSMDMQM
jgi:hypothetical protein